MNKNNNKTIEFIKIQTNLDISKCINGTQISQLKKESPDVLSRAMINLLFNVSDSLNITNKPSEIQCVEIAVAILEKYWFVKLEEICLVLKKAKYGEYGELYNRLDIQTVFNWIERYLSSEERIRYIEVQASEYKKKDKERIEMTDEVREKFREVYEKFIEKFPPNKIKERTVKNDKFTSYEKYISELKELIPHLTLQQLKELLTSFNVRKSVDCAKLVSDQIEKIKAL